MRVSVAYIDPDNHFWQHLEVDEGCTVLYAINQSGLLRKVPTIDLESQKVGIFGKVAKLDNELAEGDRVEVYRPIIATVGEEDDE